MLKITDPNYFLPIIEALEAGKILSTGRTRPMIIRGVCRQTGLKGEYVVKLKGSDEMWPGANLKEILGSFIAAELGFSVPEPVIIHISEDLVETMKGRHDNFLFASRSIGFNFGTVLQTGGYQEVIAGQTMSRELRTKLFEIFALDMFWENPDRRTDKTNFLSNGKDLLIYDHELAFSFTQVLSFARNPQPWLITEADMQWVSNNYCYNLLKGNSFDFSNFAGRLSCLNDQFWEKAIAQIPNEWQSEDFTTIKSYLNTIIENRDQFVSELNRVLL